MADQNPPRRLTSIVALDVAGYSARTKADETGTAAAISALRGVIEAIAAPHGGRLFNTAGDGFMLEFGSSDSAVEAACEIAERAIPKCVSVFTSATSSYSPTAICSVTVSTSPRA